ncbi:hypothetical protein PR003_g1673 [Phytophthora rubi]|uniref:Uncharacterized protein n=1 Tax=Phytophthora rubi TaxID=129364 RepID=A0A6A4G2X0_9STRA|nr:hypothetical protein PR003_g1673 [Phytophthora rubi]
MNQTGCGRTPAGPRRLSQALLPITKHLPAGDEGPVKYLPSRATHRKLAALLDSLRDVQSISKLPQADDRFIEIRPSFANYIATSVEYRYTALRGV